MAVGRFEECLDFVLDREGRTDSEPAGDPNTNWGITQAVYDEFRRVRNLPTQDVDKADPMELKSVYAEVFWYPAKCDEMPAPLDLLHFDTAVNNGVATANRMLQTALNVGIVDGVMGPRTMAAVKAADPSVTYARYCNLRITRYIVISASKPQLRRDFRGWLHRVGYLLLKV